MISASRNEFDQLRVYRTEKELAGMDDAHEGMIWDMSWHPLGHMLVSGSNDHTTFVLCLPRMSDEDRFSFSVQTLLDPQPTG